MDAVEKGDWERAKRIARSIREKTGEEVFSMEGEVFYEVLDLGGRRYEHAGFRDKEGKFGDFLFSLLGPEKKPVKVRVWFEILERE